MFLLNMVHGLYCLKKERKEKRSKIKVMLNEI